MLLKISLAIFSTMVLSCGTTGKQTNTTTETSTTAETSTTTITVDSKKMLAAGFRAGTIVYSDVEGDCPYTILLKDNKSKPFYVDPINLDEAYMKDGEKIWVKYNGLGRMNRCTKAAPVSISEIQKRAK